MIGSITDGGYIMIEFDASVPAEKKNHNIFMGKTFSTAWAKIKVAREAAEKNTVASLAKKAPHVYVTTSYMRSCSTSANATTTAAAAFVLCCVATGWLWLMLRGRIAE